jgi:hypothetical protein
MPLAHSAQVTLRSEMPLAHSAQVTLRSEMPLAHSAQVTLRSEMPFAHSAPIMLKPIFNIFGALSGDKGVSRRGSVSNCPLSTFN